MIEKHKAFKLYPLVIFFICSNCIWAQNDDLPISEKNEVPCAADSSYAYEFSMHLSNSFELAVGLALDKNVTDISDKFYKNFLQDIVDRLFRAYLTFRGKKNEVHPYFFRGFSLYLFHVVENLGEYCDVEISQILDDPLGIGRWPDSAEIVYAELPQRITLSGLRLQPDLYRELVSDFYEEIGFEFKDGNASVRTDRRQR